MSRAAGAGSPHWFHCPVKRRERVWPGPYPEGHEVTLTGRKVRKRPRGSLGSRSTFWSREYVCTCGHRGWSTHRDLERLEASPE